MQVTSISWYKALCLTIPLTEYEPGTVLPTLGHATLRPAFTIVLSDSARKTLDSNCWLWPLALPLALPFSRTAQCAGSRHVVILLELPWLCADTKQGAC